MLFCIIINSHFFSNLSSIIDIKFLVQIDFAIKNYIKLAFNNLFEILC